MGDYYTRDWKDGVMPVLGVLAAVVAIALLVLGARYVFVEGDAPGTAPRGEGEEPSPSPAGEPTAPELAELFMGDHDDLALAGRVAVDFAAEAASVGEGDGPSDYHDRLAPYTSFDMTTRLPTDPHVETLYEQLSELGTDTVGSAEIFQLRIEGADTVEVSVNVHARYGSDPQPIGLVDLSLGSETGEWKVTSIHRFLH